MTATPDPRDEAKVLDYLKRLTTDLKQTRQRLRAVEAKRHEPIAIVGMACRLPGGVASPEQQWELLTDGRDAISGFPTDRGWDLSAETGSPLAAGACASTQGGFLYDAAEFDPGLFGISPREALAMDPQQRLLLETSWEAIERARIAPTSLRGSQTGVFAGVMYHDYGSSTLGRSAHPELAGYLGNGTAGSIASGRVAYTFGLEGPALTVDTACSSSLVALHLACQSLRQDDCSMALAGGVSVLSTPSALVEFSHQNGLAADGRCKAFADSADGTGLAEGATMLLLERVSDAQRLGHPILAVVRGSAVNQDGLTSGLTAPNGQSQERVIRQALTDAGLSPADVDLVEAHGTGTALGDPIEAQAILATYGQKRAGPVWLGSLKSNIGHTQAAAGVAGVMKTVLAMSHGVFPRTLHADNPTSHVDWDSGDVRLLTENRPWPETDRPRRAGVSSFGVSGTNAHVIVEQADSVSTSADILPAEGPLLWAVSGHTRAALREQAASVIPAAQREQPADIGTSLAMTRAQLTHRAVIVGEDQETLLAGLRAVAKDDPAAHVFDGTASSGPSAFLFAGQGSQRVGMGRQLCASFPVFAEAFDEVCAHLDLTLPAAIDDEEKLDRTDYAQAALFAVEVALFRLLESWGITPDFLIGHSIGEVAAAHVADVLSLADACALVSARGRLMQALPDGGSMVAVRASEEAVRSALPERTCIAAVNGPESVVVSGDTDAVDGFVAGWGKCRRLRVSHAFHSHLMEPMLREFGEVVRGLSFNTPRIPVLATAPGEMDDPEYWVRQVREPVRFADALNRARSEGARNFLELGPDSVLTSMGAECVADGTFVPALRADQPENLAVMRALARLYASGCDLDWSAVLPQGRRVELPTIAFQRERFWLDGSSVQANVAGTGLSPGRHPLLAAAVSLADGDGCVYSGSIDARGWLADHVVAGRTIVPATALVEAALAAGQRFDCGELVEFTLHAPLVLPDSEAVALQVRVGSANDSGVREVSVSSQPDGSDEHDWVRNATGLLASGFPARDPVVWPSPEPVAVDGVYERMSEAGLDYGTTFRCVERAWRDGDEVYVEIAAPDEIRDDRFLIHPALFDAALHGLGLAGIDQARMPFSWSGVVVHGRERGGSAPSRLWVRLSARSAESVAVVVFDESGRPVVSVDELSVRPLPADGIGARTGDWLFRVEWERVSTAPTDPATVDWVYPGSVGEALEIVQQRVAGEEMSALAVVVEQSVSAAAVQGLVRSAQAEHPDRFVLVECVGEADFSLIPDAVAVGEPEVAIRDGELFVPRLQRASTDGRGRSLNPAGTVLITGGTGVLGGLVAQHVVAKWGARHVLLVGRRGHADVPELDADVTVAACDVSDRKALAELITAIPEEHPLTAVIHMAGVLDDGVVESLTPERMRTVFAAKADAAWNLHELTESMSLEAFVMFSSAAGVFGAPGQANYAAANAALDALAVQRRSMGLPALSLAWGLWETPTGMTGQLGETDFARIDRAGSRAMSTEQGLALFDRAMTGTEPVLVPMRLDPAATPNSRHVPLLLNVLARSGLRSALPAAPGKAEWDGANSLELIRGHAAAVLGHSDPTQIDPERAFLSAGFDSLTAVELRNRLHHATGLRLPPTLLFDYPTPAELARHLRDEFDGRVTEVVSSAAREADGDPIVIVAATCRLPGGVSSPEQLWELVDQGSDGISEFPNDRGWESALADDDCPIRHGGFLHDMADFDASLFGISPREAMVTDPQQRVLLEASWETFERARIDPQSLRGSAVGVFAGAMYHDYEGVAATVADGEDSMGSAGSIISGRIAYTFGLQGPALTVDTACSSSLVAIHLAAQAVRQGECEMALAGGVSLMASPTPFVAFARQGALAPDGRVKAFAEGADGTAWSEGAGLVLLERLSEARRHGRPILGVIRGSAVNQDGASNGLTAPNGPSQQRVIRQALADARLTGSDIDVVEAHGTGTSLGDPIEAQALLATYGNREAWDEPLWVGSLKSNIGHAQAASGVAAVIKVIESMRHGVMPKTLNVGELTTQVDWSAGSVAVLTEPRDWPDADRPRRAAVSSFGLSGTNAHLILEGVPERSLPEAVREPLDETWVPWVLSAGTESGLREQAARLSTVDATRSLLDVGFSLQSTRARLEHRAVVIGGGRDGARDLAAGRTARQLVSGLADVTGKVVFVFPGQGAQWAGMAAELIEVSDTFAARMAECETALAPYVDWSLFEALADPEAQERVDVVQPLLWAVMVSLAELWRMHGVTPDAVVGHSQGEIAAACVAGALSVSDAAAIVALRSRELAAIAGQGAMASVPLPADEVTGLLSGGIGIAAVNGPASTVVSGDVDGILALLDHCEGSGVRARRIPVDYASHSTHVEEIDDRLRTVLDGIRPMSSSVPLFSTVTGEWLDTARMDAEYWYRNLRETVRLHAATRVLLSEGHSFFVEISPHPVLLSGLQETIDDEDRDDAIVLGTLRRDDGGFDRFLLSVAEAFVRGMRIDWSAAFRGSDARQTDLPTYPFQRRRYWPEPHAKPGGAAGLGLTAAEHGLLGAGTRLPDGGLLYTGQLSLRTHPWLCEHALLGTVLLPGTAFVEMAIRAGSGTGPDRQLDELIIETPLTFAETTSVQVHVVVGITDEVGHRSVAVYSSPDGNEWVRHASGTLAEPRAVEEPSSHDWPPAGADPVELDGFYDSLAQRGFAYGPSFAGLQAAWRTDDEVFAEIALPEEVGTERFELHPALLDAALHGSALLADDGQARLPFAWNGVTLHAVGAAQLRVRLHRLDSETLSLRAFDTAGLPVADVESLSLRPVAAAELDARPRLPVDSLFALSWIPADSAQIATARTSHDIGAGQLDEVPDPVPDVVIAVCPGDVRDAVNRALHLVQEWSATDRFASARLMVVTRAAVSVDHRNDVADVAAAAVWGLLRSGQSESPGRFVLVDDDGGGELPLADLVALEEPQLAVREGEILLPRLTRAEAAPTVPTGGEPWRLEVTDRGTLDNVAPRPYRQGQRPLDAGEVRLAVRAAGVNFRDVLLTLGMVEQEGLSGEGAGVVLEVGRDVTAFAPGDRVFGMFPSSIASVTVADQRLLAPLPVEWSFAMGASVPVAFLTAYYGLLDLGELRAGESLLVHAGTGGVGMAAIQLAQQLGVEVFATASEGKWAALREFGLDDAHIASSRTLEFESVFHETTGGRGVDVVLNSLANEFVDASLRLLPRGGRFLEMGKTDQRDPSVVADHHPGVVYMVYDLVEAGPDRIGEMLGELRRSFTTGRLKPIPVTSWDARHAAEALRFLSHARHVGKIALSIPAPLDPDGTVLITGGTGVLGSYVARHLVMRHGMRRLLLISRHGIAAEGACALRDELAERGADVTIAACDAADRADLASVLTEAGPLTAVIHAAGVLADGMIDSLTEAQVEKVLRPKVDAARHLDELTREHDLSAFVLFSSAAGVLGGAGQANYAAANAYLDALAHQRRSRGLPAQSLAWGFWQPRSSMTQHVDDADLERMSRSGITPLPVEDGLALLDRALDSPEAMLLPVPLDTDLLRGLPEVPALLRSLVRRGVRRAENNVQHDSRWAEHWRGLSQAEQERMLLGLVRDHAATVLGYGHSDQVAVHKAFQELGFDSLTAVELRNRIGATTGLRLSATAIFDYPTPKGLVNHLRERLLGQAGTASSLAPSRAAPADEPIAIVAMACRFPGDVSGPEELWQLVVDEIDAVGPLPNDRGWDLDALYDAESERAGTSYVRGGGFLRDVASFDAEFFGISPREALAMDPQQRMLLETSWEVLERAGWDPTSMAESRTGVFIGTHGQDYALGGSDEQYLITGSGSSALAGRISYVFGLEGPALTVDTACSSSLVSLHLAAQALRQGECETALAGGVSVLSTPSGLVGLSRQRALSPDGRCRAFSAEANGFGMAEGVGVLLLERLSEAQRRGHQILAVVRGSAVNNDGASNGLTAPNRLSQERVIGHALDVAGLSGEDVDAVEAHGTGTTLGDPIEAQALVAAYGSDRTRPLWVGSVKSNIGHAQGAAGVAGVIKMVMALRNGVLPKSLHCETPSSYVDWSATPISLLSDAQSWSMEDRPRRAGISSFGVTGTNAHVIVEQAPPVEPAQLVPTRSEPSPSSSGAELVLSPWVLSAHSPDSLSAQAARLYSYVLESDATPLDVGYSLATSRAMLHQRAVVLGSDRDEFVRGLAELSDSAELSDERLATHVVRGATTVGVSGRPVFVFPGQGAQWVGMALKLRASSPVFAAKLKECADLIEPLVDWKLVEALADEAALERVDVVQPALWAVMVSLAELWRAHGVTPSGVIGHSQGEVAAAVVAGALSAAEGARIVVLRSKAIAQRLEGTGTMASLMLPRHVVAERIASMDGSLTIAAVNGPESTIISGDARSVEQAVAQLESEGVWVRRIAVDFASHSAHMEHIESEVLEAFADIEPTSAPVPLYSTVYGRVIDTASMDAHYWYANLRYEVRFEQAVESAVDDGCRLYIEVSPHPTLTAGIGSVLQRRELSGAAVGSLRRHEDDTAWFTRSLAEAWVNGIEVEWKDAYRDTDAQRVGLPTYAFQRGRFWLDPGSSDSRGRAYPTAVDSEFWAAVEQEDQAAFARILGTVDEDGAAHDLAAGLPVLSRWYRAQRGRQITDRWRYHETWRSVDDIGSAGLSATWLVVVPDVDLPVVEPVIHGLGEGTCVLTIAADVERGELAARIIEAIGDCDLGGVLSLLPLDERPHPEHGATPVGFAQSLALLQALGDRGITAPLWCVTQTAVATSVSDVVIRPQQSLLWGLARVAGLEHGDRWGGVVDLPLRVDGSAVERLIAIVHDAGVDQAAIRGGEILGRRLVPAPPEERDVSTTWSPHGTVLITGGTGALGSHVARWSARNGAENLLLLSRSGPDATGASELEGDLRELGALVTVRACDASDRNSLEQALSTIPADYPLTAVVHTAAVLDDSAIESLTREQVDRALRAKVVAAINLDEVTRDRELSAFVLFSSIGGTIGTPGQGNYAPGNAFLDQLAWQRRAEGLPVTTLSWGAWAGDGMAQGRVGELMERHGIVPMPPELALDSMAQAVHRAETFLVLADFDWKRFYNAFTADRANALFDEIPEIRSMREASAAGSDVERSTGLATRLTGLPQHDRRTALHDVVRTELGFVLGYSSSDDVDDERPLNELGLDSVTAVELRNRLKKVTGLALPTTLAFDHPTVRALAGYLDGELFGNDAVPVRGADPASAHDEPIAIVSTSCRFPGGVCSPEDLWSLLESGVDAIDEPPSDRHWPSVGSQIQGGFLTGAGDFDADLFGISPREALAMDPQQRLALELSWEVLERAGIDPLSQREQRTGVFLGAYDSQYISRLRSVPDDLAGYLSNGNSMSVASGRVAYAFGLRGPTLTVDTACSSSLVALHLAVQSLRRGESDLAIAGGVSVMSTPGVFMEFDRQGGLAPDGRCKSFASEADGTGFAEGIGMVLVERLADAERNGHTVLAVLRGSATNSDGASNGLTAPNGPAQERVIRSALADARLHPTEVDAVEAHGTGTTLGDPIEAASVLATYGHGRAEPLWLGSLKSNIGHCQAAAGIGGVIKAVLALGHGKLPRTLHVGEPTSHVDWSAGDVRLLTEEHHWTGTNRPRRIGVSSFGISGTNAHVILEQHAAQPQQGEPTHVDRPIAWLLHGRTEGAVRGQARRLSERARSLEAVDVATSLATARARLEHRAVVVGKGREELLNGVARVAAGESGPGVTVGRARQRSTIAFVFSGQGGQRARMGAELYSDFPVFAETFDAVCALLDPAVGEVVRSDPDRLDQTEFAQQALFAFQVAFARLLESWGVRPHAVAGHSVGELAAAHVAGVLSLQDAATLVQTRARLMQACDSGGAMVAIQASEEEIQPSLSEHVALAAVNGPEAVVISGDSDAVEGVAGAWSQKGRKTNTLRVSHAFHSHHMDGMLAKFSDTAKQLSFQQPSIRFVPAAGTDYAQPEYWVRQVRDAVRFHRALTELGDEPNTTFVEIGPDAPLTAIAGQSVPGAAFIATQRAGRSESATLLAALGELHVRGSEVSWPDVLPAGRRVDLPTYAFQHEHFWLTDRPSHTDDVRTAGLTSAEHPLLGGVMELPDRSYVVSGRLSLDTHPWLADHVVGDQVLLPGTALLELALRTGELIGCPHVDTVNLMEPFVLPEAGFVILRVQALAPDDHGRREITISSRNPELGDDAEWSTHADGVVVPDEPSSAEGLTEWPPENSTAVDVSGAYDRLAELGLRYGPSFQLLRSAWRRGDELFVEVASPDKDGQQSVDQEFLLHPALLDAGLHAMAMEATELRLPFMWTGVSVVARAGNALRVRITPVDEASVRMVIADSNGLPVGSVRSLATRPIAADEVRVRTRPTDLFHTNWTPVGAPEPVLARWFLLDERSDRELPASIETAESAEEAGYALIDMTGDADEMIAGTLSALERLLDQLRECLAVPNATVVVLTSDSSRPSSGAVRGFLRSAQQEYPQRIIQVRLDDPEDPDALGFVPAAVGIGEPEIAVRSGEPHVPRLSRVRPAEENRLKFAPDGTVLITGGTGAIGRVLAKHLAVEYGVGRLILLGRRAKADDLVAELAELGVDVRVLACDVSDRAALAEVLDSIPAEHPLTGVVHAAGVVEDSVIENLTPEQIVRVLEPKAHAAWHLHELTRDLDLAVFVTISSVAGVIGNAGQAHYGAANAFLDALAEFRRELGLPGLSLAWGPWDSSSGMVSDIPDVALARMARGGITLLSKDQGLTLFDAAVVQEDAVLSVVRFDQARMRASGVPPLLRSVISQGRSTRDDTWLKRYSELVADERLPAVLHMVRAEAATVLGHRGPERVDPERPFTEAGFDSLAAVDLSNALRAITGLVLPATLLFDYPNPMVMAEYLHEHLTPSIGATTLSELDKMSALLSELDSGDELRSQIRSRLRALLAQTDEAEGTSRGEVADQLNSATPDEVLAFLDQELK